MRKLIIILALLFQSGGIYANNPTLLGTHGSNDPKTLRSLGVQIARYGFSDDKIKSGIISGTAKGLNKIRKLDSLGIQSVVFLTWPDSASVDEYERIPTGADSAEVFKYLNIFLDQVGRYINYIQISQEPFGASSYDPSQKITDILNWWRTVAQFIRNKQISNPIDLGHIKLIAGGITGVSGAINNPNSPIASLIDSLITFGEDYCDAIDLHLHVTDITMGENIIKYIKFRTNHRLSCTEWSQAKAAGPNGTNWLNNVNTAFDSPHPFAGLTNKRIIENAYSSPIDSSEWKVLISTSPFTTGFIADFYALMDSNCFKFACYAGVFQYGSPLYDWNHLIASQTVVQYRYHNNPFYNEFVNLSGIISDGLYQSNCSTSSMADAPVESKQNILVYPNPFDDFTTLEFDNGINETYTLNLFNILGEKVRAVSNISTDRITISREGLKSGDYFFQLLSGKRIVVAGKLLIR